MLPRPRPKGEPARPTLAQVRSGWAWARAFPRRSLALVSRLWRTERRGAVLGLLVVLAAALVLALLGADGQTIWEILATLGLCALVVTVSADHRTSGAVVVTVLSLSLIGTLAGPRWTPEPLAEPMVPSTADTTIGGETTTAAVGSYRIETSTVTITQADGEQVPALLRRPVGVTGPTPGVVFLHGAGTHDIHGFSSQAEALSSAGATTLVPSKPMEDYSLASRDYRAMAADYQRSVDYLIALDGVDAARVGLYAESEGAIPGAVLTAVDERIAFLVMASAPVVRLREQMALAMDSYMRNVGVPDPMLVLIPRLLGSAQVPGGGFEYADFDSVPYLERITVPVLMVYGTSDASMPLVQGPATVWRALQRSGNDALTVRYYDGANHGLRVGSSADGDLAPGVTRDLARWVTGLPDTADAAPHVAGATPTQTYWARAPESTRWYASGDLMLAAFVLGFGLLALAAVLWAAGQAPRLRGRRGVHLPDPIGRWTASLGLSIVAAWALYLAYIAGVVSLARSYRTSYLFSYGGWMLAQLVALGTVILYVRLAQRVWLMRRRMRRGREEGGRWLTVPAGCVLGSALCGTAVLLTALAYWGLFPLLY